VTAPRAAIYGLNGQWEVENVGIAPDYDVDLDPAKYRLGEDTQLSKAIEIVMQQLQQNPSPQYPRPAYPNYHLNDDLSQGKKTTSQ
jgi:tricorn protease